MSSDIYHQQLYQSAREAKNLPVPDEPAQQHSQELIRHICERIRQKKGAISFRHYMDMALHTPGLGYYAAGSIKLGKAGDFITAPEISPLFSHSLANAILPALKENPIILEVGAGSGCMAADILLFLEQINCLPEEYWILELSAELRERQQQTIKQKAPALFAQVKWLDTLPDKFSAVVLANELLDAMPVQLFQKTAQAVYEIQVVWQEQRFIYDMSGTADTRLSQRVADIEQHGDMIVPDGYISEVNFAAEDWLTSLASCLQQGVMVLIDNGFPRHEFYHQQRNKGTLMCHYRHRSHDDPFAYPGLQDITAHIDFTAIADAALASNMKVLGYSNQFSFLMGAGILELADKMHFNVDEANIKTRLSTAAQIKKLTFPHEMGELFKVIALSKNSEVILPAFMFNDMRSRL